MTPEKVTPKFKVGDVVVGSDGHEREILGIGRVNYFYRDLTTGVEFCTGIVLTDVGCSLKPKEVTITREKFAEAWDKHLADERIMPAHSNLSLTFDDICKELGL